MNKIKEIPFVLAVGISGSASTDAIDLSLYDNEHRFSVQYNVTGSGTVTLEAECSNDGVNFVDYATEIVVSYATASGWCLPDTFTPPLCRWMKLKATETGGAAVASIAGVLCIQ